LPAGERDEDSFRKLLIGASPEAFHGLAALANADPDSVEMCSTLKDKLAGLGLTRGDAAFDLHGGDLRVARQLLEKILSTVREMASTLESAGVNRDVAVAEIGRIHSELQRVLATKQIIESNTQAAALLGPSFAGAN